MCFRLLLEKCLYAAKYIQLPNREGDTLQRGPFEDTILCRSIEMMQSDYLIFVELMSLLMYCLTK